MKHTSTQTIILLLLLVNLHLLQAQEGCILKPPLLHIDFGKGDNVPEFNATAHANYERVNDNCPTDGFYAYTNYTSQCFNNDWFTLRGDHTGNGGNMMLVNASESGGSFFNTIIQGLQGNTTYELAVWFMNVCRIHGGCSPLPPNIHVSLITFTGKKVAEFQTGELRQGYSPEWKKYAAFFTTPPNETMLGLTLSNMTTGGCGNDFAMDDITVRECIKPEAAVVEMSKQEVKPVQPAIKETTPSQADPKPVAKADPPVPGLKKDTTLTVNRQPIKPIEKASAPDIQKNPIAITLPPVLTTRANPIVKTIKTTAGEMIVELYDNGQVDGDTVTIYHNNELLVSHAALSQVPIRFTIPVDAKHPHHELVMVADNLGSIPPNTSLMILRIKDKRYDVFISSSEQKNARLVIELGE